MPSSAGECWLSEGDVLRLNPGPRPDPSSANLVVLASEGQNYCRTGSTVTLGIADLQDMQNHMRETIDQGLGELQKRQGLNGIPAALPSAIAQPVEAGFAALAPPPDPNAPAELSAQAGEAERAEQQALTQSDAGGPTASAAQPSFQGSCDESALLKLMHNPPTAEWRQYVSGPLRQIEAQGFNAYIQNNGGVSALMAKYRRDLKMYQGGGPKGGYADELCQAWIDVLECTSHR